MAKMNITESMFDSLKKYKAEQTVHESKAALMENIGEKEEAMKKSAKMKKQELGELLGTSYVDDKHVRRISTWLTNAQADRLEELVKKVHNTKSNMIRACLLAGMDEIERKLNE